MLNFTVPNMSCGGCANSVRQAICSLDARAEVQADPPRRHLAVATSLTRQQVEAVLAEAGYPAA